MGRTITMVKSLKQDLFSFKNSEFVNGLSEYSKQMEDPNNNIGTYPQIERSDPVIGTSDSRYQPLDNVNLVFTSKGENFSITLHEVIGRLVLNNL